MSVLDPFGLPFDNDGDMNLDIDYSSSPPISFIEGLHDQPDDDLEAWLEDDNDVVMSASPPFRDQKEMTKSLQESFQAQLHQQLENPSGHAGAAETDFRRDTSYLASPTPERASAASCPPPAPPAPPPPARAAGFAPQVPGAGYPEYAGAGYYYPVHATHSPLSPHLSDAHTQYLAMSRVYNPSVMYPRESDSAPFYPPPPPTNFHPNPLVKKERNIAPKPPAPPPPGYFLQAQQFGAAAAAKKEQQGGRQRVISKTPVAASLPQQAKPVKFRCKRRSSSMRSDAGSLRPKQREIRHIQEQFLSSNELGEQLALLRAQLEASEAESDLLKQRLSNTENELAELRKQVSQFDSAMSPVSPATPSMQISPTMQSM